VGQTEKDIRSVLASQVTTKPIEWLGSGKCWAKGFAGFLDGDPGLGKSTITYAAIGSLSKQGIKCGIINVEDPADCVIVPRLQAANADLNSVLIYEPGDQKHEIAALQLPRDIPALGRWLENNTIKFAVIDPLVSYLERGLNYTDEQDMRQVMDPLAIIARKIEGFILAVRHWTKGTSSKAITQGGGASTIANASRLGYSVMKDPDDPGLRYFTQAKTSLSAPMPSRMFRIEVVPVPGGLEATRINWCGTTSKTADELHQASKMAPERVEVINTIKESGKALPPKDLAVMLHKKEATMRKLCTRMHKDGQLRQHWKKAGHYWPANEPDPEVTEVTPVTAVTPVTQEEEKSDHSD
jgi:hypothetical protein